MSIPLRCCLVLTGLCLFLAPAQVTSAVTSADDDDGQATISFDGHKVVRVVLTNRKQLETMLTISPDVWSEGIGLGIMDFRIPPDRMNALKRSGIGYEVLIDDLGVLIDNERQPADPLNGGWFTSYHSTDEIHGYLDVLDGVNPDITETFIAGQTLEGRDIKGIRIGGGNGNPAMVVQGGQHAREWIGPAVVTYLADHLIRRYGSDDEVTRLVDNVEWIIVPLINADGYEYTRGPNRMWRKNRRNNGNGTFGVDLNRNWAFGWGLDSGSSGNSNSDTYRGTAPFSEPETTVMSNFILANPQTAVHIDVHSYGQWLLAPWGYTEDLPPDHDLYQELGQGLQDVIRSVHGRTYVHGPASTTLYLASGIAPDWGYGELDAIGFTFELRDTGQNGFILPPDQIIPNGEEVVPAFLLLADHLTHVLAFAFPEPLPTRIDPGQQAPVSVEVVGINGKTLDQNSVTLYARVGDSGSFSDIPMSLVGGNIFQASLPAAPCNSVVQYYFAASTTDGDDATSPETAPAEVYQAISIGVTTLFADDFETDTGWTVESINLTDGAWERGVPVGGGDRFDPPADYDGTGQCYLTDNVDGDSDVDGGPTRLISPVFDLSAGDAEISYARWFANDDNDADRLDVHISNDNGSSWTLVESVGNTGGWSTYSFTVSSVIAPTSQMRLRFSATDNPNNSVTEAAIDAVAIERFFCDSITLESFDISFGSLRSGGLVEARESDDQFLRTRSQYGFLSSEPNVLVITFGFENAEQSVSTLDVTVESRLNNPNGNVRVSLRNINTNAFNLIRQYTQGTTETTEVIEDVPAAAYIAGDGSIDLRIKQVVVATFSVVGFDSYFDQVKIEAMP
ncbi:MAG: M14 family zinc carboxypeptidase [Phycisphaerales bacterium]